MFTSNGVKIIMETRADLQNGSQGSQCLRESQPRMSGLKNGPCQLGQSSPVEAGPGTAAVSFSAGRRYHLIDTYKTVLAKPLETVSPGDCRALSGKGGVEGMGRNCFEGVVENAVRRRKT